MEQALHFIRDIDAFIDKQTDEIKIPYEKALEMLPAGERLKVIRQYKGKEGLHYQTWDRSKVIILEARRILRSGRFVRLDPPDKIIYRKVQYDRKIIRCNRKGMGLRLRRNR